MSQSHEHKMALETAEHYWIARMVLREGKSAEASEMMKRYIASQHPSISQKDQQEIVTKVLSGWQASSSKQIG